MGGIFRFVMDETNANAAPEWAIPGNLLGGVPGASISLESYLYDEDVSTVSLEQIGTWPSYVTLNGAARLINITSLAPVGVLTGLQMRARDEVGNTSDVTFTLSITKGANRPPTVSAIPPQTQVAGSPAGFSLAAFCNDLDNDTKTYSISGGDLNGIQLNASTGQITVASTAEAGVRSITPAVFDGTVTVQWPAPFTLTIIAAPASGEYAASFAYDVDAYKLWNAVLKETAQTWYSAPVRHSTGTIITWGGGTTHNDSAEHTVRELDPGVEHERIGERTTDVGSPWDLRKNTDTVAYDDPPQYYLHKNLSRIDVTVTQVTGSNPWQLTVTGDLTYVVPPVYLGTRTSYSQYRVTEKAGQVLTVVPDRTTSAPTLGDKVIFNDYPGGMYNNRNMVVDGDDNFIVWNVGVFDLSNPTAGKNGWIYGWYNTTRGDQKHWPEPGPYIIGLSDNDYILGTPNSTGTALTVSQTPSVLAGFNKITSWLPDLDKGVMIQSGNFGSDPYVWLIERNTQAGSPRGWNSAKPNPWRMLTSIASTSQWTVPGTSDLFVNYCYQARDNWAAIGQYLYFFALRGETGNEGQDPRATRPFFLRIDVKSLSDTGDPLLTRLADVPQNHWQGYEIGTPIDVDVASVTPVTGGYASLGPRFVITLTTVPSGIAGVTNYTLVDSAGQKWVVVWNNNDAPQKRVIYGVPHWGPGWSSASTPALGAAQMTQRSPFGRYGAMTYDASAGLILHAGGNTGLIAYDPTDDAKGWFTLAQPVTTGPGIIDQNFLCNITYSPKTQKSYYRPGTNAGSAKWTAIDITPKAGSTGGNLLSKIDWQLAADGRPLATTQDLRGPGTSKVNNELWVDKKNRGINVPGSNRLVITGGDRRYLGFFNQAGYPLTNEPGKYNNVSTFPQEMWSIDLARVKAGQLPVMELWLNGFADFPYGPTLPVPEAASASGPNRRGIPTYSTALREWDITTNGEQRGQAAPAPGAVGYDANGDIWMGPSYTRADSLVFATTPPMYGDESFAVKRIRGAHMPAGSYYPTGVCDRTGVRLGNGWHKPPQPRWADPNAANYSTYRRTSFTYGSGTYSDIRYPNHNAADFDSATQDTVNNELIWCRLEDGWSAAAPNSTVIKIYRFPFTPNADGFHNPTIKSLTYTQSRFGSTTSDPLSVRSTLPDVWKDGTQGGTGSPASHVVIGRKLYAVFGMIFYVNWTEYDATKPSDYHGGGSGGGRWDQVSICQIDLNTYTVDRWFAPPATINGKRFVWGMGITDDHYLSPGRGNLSHPTQHRQVFGINGKLVISPARSTQNYAAYPYQNLGHITPAGRKQDPWVVTYDPATDTWDSIGTIEEMTDLDLEFYNAPNGRYDWSTSMSFAVANGLIEPDMIVHRVPWCNHFAIHDLNELWSIPIVRSTDTKGPPILRVKIP